MSRTRALFFGAVALVLLAACGRGTEGGDPVPAAGGGAVAERLGRVDPAAGDATLLGTAAVPTLGTVLTDGKGMTLYRFDEDTAKPSASTCDGECAAKWPPLVAQAAEFEVSGVDRALVSTVDRADGVRQVTVAGWPVYRFAQDTAPGDAKGQGVGGTWFAAAPDGRKVVPASAGSAGSVLATASIGNLGTVLTDAEGMTLYRFDRDTAKPPTSNCTGDCVATWPPLLVESTEFEVRGVDRSLVGTVTRVGGQRQVTVAGWPLYRFSGDEVCGEAEGQGVGGVWFAAKPDGGKAGS
ncbi:hypothetical protein AB0I60_35025 [Actinosynnema sp. NPDC050436]|uniref:hypothetical protein n=1 Tax=Actinosynnema sp. NPDC050436 TaxID=3155659 RepID=UPI0033C14C06